MQARGQAVRSVWVTMALAAPPVNERKRVKVYELKNNDWYDRGTGFCAGQMIGVSRHTLHTRAAYGVRTVLKTAIGAYRSADSCAVGR